MCKNIDFGKITRHFSQNTHIAVKWKSVPLEQLIFSIGKNYAL